MCHHHVENIAEEKLINVDREYESIEDYMKTSSMPVETRKIDIDLLKKQAYDSVQHEEMQRHQQNNECEFS